MLIEKRHKHMNLQIFDCLITLKREDREVKLNFIQSLLQELKDVNQL